MAMASDPATSQDINESLRECCCIGDVDGAISHIRTKGADINSQNRVNGWTALHWASKRGHSNIVKFLVENGATREIRSNNGERPIDLASSDDIKVLLTQTNRNSGDVLEDETERELIPEFVPNYFTQPVFPYSNSYSDSTKEQIQAHGNPRRSVARPVGAYRHADFDSNEYSQQFSQYATASDMHILSRPTPWPCMCIPPLHFHEGMLSEMVAKIRIADLEEKEFIEIDLELNKLTYNNLLNTCASELGMDSNDITRIRKLPNTIIRKDKDVKRLIPYQELEVIIKPAMSSTATSESVQNEET